MSGVGWALGCCVGALWCWPLSVGRPDRPAAGSTRRMSLREALRMVARRLRGSAAGDESEVFETLLAGISPAIQAGVPPLVAVSTAASVALRTTSEPQLRAQLLRLHGAAVGGAPLADTWAQLAARYPQAGLGPVARAWSLSDRVGCGLSEAVAAAVRLMSQGQDQRRRIAAATAGPRASMQVLTLLPLLGVGISMVVGIDPIQLYSDGVGRVSLGLGLLLTWLGRRLVAAMIRRSCAPEALK